MSYRIALPPDLNRRPSCYRDAHRHDNISLNQDSGTGARVCKNIKADKQY
ncbi:hypothetical protein [Microcoleus sp. FACHB-672]|nr:hypothetical protein [Microcoleus sp. FACHB-672]MBD2043738.1 hypothetical protein [Microcoleus sp. FACHB-672]